MIALVKTIICFNPSRTSVSPKFLSINISIGCVKRLKIHESCCQFGTLLFVDGNTNHRRSDKKTAAVTTVSNTVMMSIEAPSEELTKVRKKRKKNGGAAPAILASSSTSVGAGEAGEVEDKYFQIVWKDRAKVFSEND